jgi:conjugal transfer/entry exclusion protein
MCKVYQSVMKFLKKVPWSYMAGAVLLVALILGALYYRAEAARQRVLSVATHDPLSMRSMTYGLNRPLLDRVVSAFTVPDSAQPGAVAPPQVVVVEKTVEVEKVVEVVKTVEVENTGSRGTTETRMVVYSVDMSIVVKDTQATLKQIEQLTSEVAGYVVSAQTTQYDAGLYGSIMVRVPASELDNVLAQLEGLALEVRSLNKSGTDVTEEYVDLESRVKVMEAAEQELLELYQTRQADGEVTEILEVYQQLVAFREEIESLTGRRQYLAESAAMAKVTISVIPDALAQPVQIGRWQPGGTARDAFEVLVSSGQFLVDMLIWGVILVLPLALLVGGAFFGIGRLIRRRRRRVQSLAEPPIDTK